IYATVRLVLRDLRFEQSPEKEELLNWYKQRQLVNQARYNDSLTSEFDLDTYREAVAPEYDEIPKIVDGREVLNACFDANFASDGGLMALGAEDGRIGDVNQGVAGLQEKFGAMSIFDTGIRESVTMGKGMGMAMRGQRPIAEIQYLDYLIHALP